MKLDETSPNPMITKDASSPTLPLSVVMHIDYKKRRITSSASAT